MVLTHMFTELQQQPPLRIDIISNHSDIGVLADQINVKINHKPKQWRVFFLGATLPVLVAERLPFVSTQTGGDGYTCCESIKRCHMSFIVPPTPPPHTLLMFLCGFIGGGVFIKPLLFTAPLQLVCNVVTGPFITALSHFQWSCSQSSNKGANGTEAVLRKEKKIKSTLLLPFAGGFVTHSVRQISPLERSALPFSGKGIIYLKVDFHLFFFHCWSASFVSSSLHCLLSARLRRNRRDSALISCLLLFARPSPPPLCFLLRL